MFALFGMQLVLMKYRICLLSPETQQLKIKVKTYFVYNKVAYAADEHCPLTCGMNTALFTVYASPLFMYLNLLLWVCCIPDINRFCVNVKYTLGLLVMRSFGLNHSSVSCVQYAVAFAVSDIVWVTLYGAGIVLAITLVARLFAGWLKNQFDSQQGQEILSTYLPTYLPIHPPPTHPADHLAVTEVCMIIFITYVFIFPCLFA